MGIPYVGDVRVTIDQCRARFVLHCDLEIG